uniref:Uncharacterized protein n=1 Tax=Helicoverpa armigera nucleopolyhedrovirus TaxID=51313 RepID=A0A482ET26_9ABAC|nr:hypothetical protein [Helicoverpa armigera nucleopolyhedrovirus]
MPFESCSHTQNEIKNKMDDYTYNDLYVKASQHNVLKRIVNRELDSRIDKLSSVLNLQRLTQIVQKAPCTLNYDNRKCPSQYEAESVDLAKFMKRKYETIVRCKLCTRSLHGMLDKNKSVCTFCLNATSAES